MSLIFSIWCNIGTILKWYRKYIHRPHMTVFNTFFYSHFWEQFLKLEERLIYKEYFDERDQFNKVATHCKILSQLFCQYNWMGFCKTQKSKKFSKWFLPLSDLLVVFHLFSSGETLTLSKITLSKTIKAIKNYCIIPLLND
jgi:ADP-heptose:LPS heptosyltransferase